jgi:hypothetical protein
MVGDNFWIWFTPFDINGMIFTMFDINADKPIENWRIFTWSCLSFIHIIISLYPALSILTKPQTPQSNPKIKQIQHTNHSFPSVVIIRVDFSFCSDQSQSNNCTDNEIIVLDWSLGVLGFVIVLIWHFWEVNLWNVETVGNVFHWHAVLDSAIVKVVELACEGVVLLKEHDFCLCYENIIFFSIIKNKSIII